MFGGSHYPRTAEWLNNYAEEISQQVQPCACVCMCVFMFLNSSAHGSLLHGADRVPA